MDHNHSSSVEGGDGVGERTGEELARFLERRVPGTEAMDVWGDGTMPLRIITYLTPEVPPSSSVTSVRGLVVRDESVLVVWDETGHRGRKRAHAGFRPSHGGDHPMDTVRETLEQALAGYAGEMLNGFSYLTTTADGAMFAVIGLSYVGQQRFVDTSLVVRLDRNTIVIERDVNNKPLVDALLADGIPRSQIVLAFAGESAPAAA